MNRKTYSSAEVRESGELMKLVAMSELAKACGIAQSSESFEVKSFGMLMLMRLAKLANGETAPYVESYEELEPYIEAGTQFNDLEDG
jgi:hypothetical protein